MIKVELKNGVVLDPVFVDDYDDLTETIKISCCDSRGTLQKQIKMCEISSVESYGLPGSEKYEKMFQKLNKEQE